MYSYQPQMANTAIAIGQMLTRAAEASANIMMEGAKTRASMRMQAATTNAGMVMQGWSLRAQLAMDKYKADLSASVSREQIAASRAAAAANAANAAAQLRLEEWKMSAAERQAAAREAGANRRADAAEAGANQRASMAADTERYKADLSAATARKQIEAQLKLEEGRGRSKDTEEDPVAKMNRAYGEARKNAITGGAPNDPYARKIAEAYAANTREVDHNNGTITESPYYSSYLTKEEKATRQKFGDLMKTALPNTPEAAAVNKAIEILYKQETRDKFKIQQEARGKRVAAAVSNSQSFTGGLNAEVSMDVGDSTVAVPISIKNIGQLEQIKENAIKSDDWQRRLLSLPVSMDFETQKAAVLGLSSQLSIGDVVGQSIRFHDGITAALSPLEINAVGVEKKPVEAEDKTVAEKIEDFTAPPDPTETQKTDDKSDTPVVEEPAEATAVPQATSTVSDATSSATSGASDASLETDEMGNTAGGVDVPTVVTIEDSGSSGEAI